MADNNKMNDAPSTVETTDRGLFDFMKKKEAPPHQEGEAHVNVISGVQKMHVSEPKSECEEKDDEENKHGGLLDKLHRSHSSSSSSSSSDEEGDDEEKMKKRKEKKEKKKAGLKEKIEEKIGGHKEEHHHEDTAVPIEKVHVQENVYSEQSYPAPGAPGAPDHHHQEPDEKKGGFLDKIKDKLPGTTKPDEHTASVAAPVQAATEPCVEGDKEKKGFLDKIKEKIPGFHPKSDAHEEKKDHD